MIDIKVIDENSTNSEINKNIANMKIMFFEELSLRGRESDLCNLLSLEIARERQILVDRQFDILSNRNKYKSSYED